MRATACHRKKMRKGGKWREMVAVESDVPLLSSFRVYHFVQVLKGAMHLCGTNVSTMDASFDFECLFCKQKNNSCFVKYTNLETFLGWNNLLGYILKF